MNYRQFGRIDWNVSALGFGCMRFPEKDNQIDEPAAVRMLHTAIDAGVNYIDTAWPYHNEQSEPLVGRALAENGYRQKVRLATKLPSWSVHKAEDMDRFLHEQLKRLQTEQIDFYLLHTLNREYWDRLTRLDVLSWAEKKVAQGKIAHLGFSFHDEYPVFAEILAAYDWDFCQIQYNYMNLTHQAGRRGLKEAAKKGLAVVIMEPLLGGSLAKTPESVQKIWDDAPVQRSPVDWALQWLWDQPEVSVVLSGMSSLEQVEQNLAAAAASGPERFTESDHATIKAVQQAFSSRATIPCTTCGYCMPCPHGVDIPRNFTAYNKATMFDAVAEAKGEYRWMRESFERGIAPADQRAAACIACGECEPKCPQHIPISTRMAEVDAFLRE